MCKIGLITKLEKWPYYWYRKVLIKCCLILFFSIIYSDCQPSRMSLSNLPVQGCKLGTLKKSEIIQSFLLKI